MFVSSQLACLESELCDPPRLALKRGGGRPWKWHTRMLIIIIVSQTLSVALSSARSISASASIKYRSLVGRAISQTSGVPRATLSPPPSTTHNHFTPLNMQMLLPLLAVIAAATVVGQVAGQLQAPLANGGRKTICHYDSQSFVREGEWSFSLFRGHQQVL